MKPDNVYQKGPLILHMLREQLGEDVFWRGVHTYIDRFKYEEVETDDFRRVLEEVSGENLELFFDQWVWRPGLPKLRVDVDWDDQASQLVVNIAQTQMVNEANPPYVFDLPIDVELDSGTMRISVPVSKQRTLHRVRLDQSPAAVAVNPDITIAAPATVNVRLP